MSYGSRNRPILMADIHGEGAGGGDVYFQAKHRKWGKHKFIELICFVHRGSGQRAVTGTFCRGVSSAAVQKRTSKSQFTGCIGRMSDTICNIM